jgi:glucose/arabinose dehydrogenase
VSGFIQLGATELSFGERDGSVLIPVTRTGDVSQPVTVQYRLDSETATAGQDFTAQTGVILTTTIPAGAGSVLVPVPILNDAQSEATETFTISIVGVDSGMLLTPRTARVSILDDENPVTPPASPPLLSDYNVQMQPVISGLSEPIDIDFSPLDPSIGYVATKAGQVYAYDFETGARLSTVLDLSAKANNFQDRGLLGVTLHPDLADNPYLYAFYVADPADTAGKTGNAGPDGGGNRFSYVSRFTLDATDGHLSVVPGSETVLVGGAGQTLADISGNGAIDSTSSISTPTSEIDAATGLYKDDYLKVDSRSHAGGGLAFGPDGMLYVSVGDGTSYNFADPRTISVQSVDSLSGKILRIDPLTGDGLPDNPFVEPGDSLSANSSKVYQLGLRNPFRIAFDDEGRLIMSETGWNTYEELNTGGPGANFGWPYFEGGDGGVSIKTLQYPSVLPNASAFYAAVDNGTIVITAPFRAINHQDSAPGYQFNSIVGGSGFLDGPNYPGSLQNSYLFTNFDKGQIFAVDVNNRQDLAYLAKAEILELHYDDDGIVVVGLDDVDVVRAEAGHRP